MDFSKSYNCLMVVEAMNAKVFPKKKRSLDWKYRLKDVEFYKCLYLASFMQKNKFPVPNSILIPYDDQASLQSASAIKYAMGQDWMGVRIKESFNRNKKKISIFQMLKSNINFHKKLNSEINFNIVISPNTLDVFGKLCCKAQPNYGDAILFEDKNARSLERTDIRCNKSFIPNTVKLKKAKNNFDFTLDMPPVRNVSPKSGFNISSNANLYENMVPGISKNKDSISNKYPVNFERPRSFAQVLFDFVQTLKNDVYRIR